MGGRYGRSCVLRAVSVGLGLASVVVLLGGLSAAGASASPAWYFCAKANKGPSGYEGHYSNSTCTGYVATGGSYELVAGIAKGKSFKGKGAAAALNVVVPVKGDLKVECASFQDSGTMLPPNMVGHVTFTFAECSLLGMPCASGSKAGTIETSSLSGPLGWLDESSGAIGLELANEAAPGSGYVAQFECQGEGSFRVHGGMIARQLNDIGTVTQSFTWNFAVGPFLGEPEPGYVPLVNPLEFEGGSESTLQTELNNTETGGLWLPAGGRPSGLEAVSGDEGEALMVKAGGAGTPGEGTVTGTVESDVGPVPEAIVSICSSAGCYSAYSGEDGTFALGGIPAGSYVATISPPEGSPDGELVSSPFEVTAGAEASESFTLPGLDPLPHGTKVEGDGVVSVGGHEFPQIGWMEESPISTEACVGGTVTLTVTATNPQTGMPEATSPVTLVETAPGIFTGEIPAVHPLQGQGDVTIASSGCPDASEDETSEFTVYIYVDPSGTVVDGDHNNAPVAGATVTLLSSNSLTGTYSAVPNGSPVMSVANRLNPYSTPANGTFAWDTVPGFYEVQATKAGCGTATSTAFQVPPPKVDLQLVLHCPGELAITTKSIPSGTRGESYSVELAASGGMAPYKWKKAASLPKGLKLSSTGRLSGTPSATLAAGLYEIKVDVSAGAGKSKETAGATLTLDLS